MSNPKMILLDEPSMGLAPQLVEQIFEIVKKINEEQGVSVLLAEQNTTVALRYAKYGYILENGRVVMDGDAKDLGENEDVKEFYLGLSGGDKQSFPRRQKATSAASAGWRRRATTRGAMPSGCRMPPPSRWPFGAPDAAIWQAEMCEPGEFR